jgi:hypothetical protein
VSGYRYSQTEQACGNLVESRSGRGGLGEPTSLLEERSKIALLPFTEGSWCHDHPSRPGRTIAPIL